MAISRKSSNALVNCNPLPPPWGKMGTSNDNNNNNNNNNNSNNEMKSFEIIRWNPLPLEVEKSDCCAYYCTCSG